MAQPKQQLKISRIKDVGLISDSDAKWSKKLRAPEANQTWFKVIFFKDGVVGKGAESDESDGGKSSSPTQSWFFQCND